MRDTFCKLLCGLACTSMLLAPGYASITVTYQSYNGDGQYDFLGTNALPLSTNMLFMAYYSTNITGAGFNPANPNVPLYGDQLLRAYPLTQATPTNFPGHSGQISGYLAEYYTNAPDGNLYLAVFDCTYSAYTVSNTVPEGTRYLLTTNVMVPGVESSGGGELTDVGAAIHAYVASNGAWVADRVITYSNNAAIGLSTQQLAFASSYAATSSVAPASYILFNTGGSLMRYTNQVAYEAGASGWLVPSPVAGELDAGASIGQTCRVSVIGLNAGAYTASVSVVSADAANSPQTLTVTFAVAKANQTINFGTISQQYTTNVLTLGATASSGLPVDYGVSGPGRLAGSQLSFTGTGIVRVTASQPGSTNWFEAAAVTQSVVVVEPLPVGSLVGTLQPSFVCTNGGGWRIQGRSTWRSSGYRTDDLTPGQYLVEFRSLLGWIMPNTESVNVSAGREAQVVGAYQKRPSPNDFDGDGLSDIGCYDPALGGWYVFKSFLRAQWTVNYGGGTGTLPITGDFDGDGYCDYGTYTPSAGYWQIMRSSAGGWSNHFGFEGTLPVTGDFDGDSILDFGCYYPQSGGWYLFKSRDGFWENYFGFPGTVPVTGDFDGDGIGDFGCYYPETGRWYLYKSRNGFWENYF
ncbi:MAG: VCBS repeat-containing protein, partial [Kiritimatiellae bacterium]|nr:VCBS repeat-containing protein [Kiritimatiellia bacterium]